MSGNPEFLSRTSKMPPLTVTETETRNRVNVQRMTDTDGMFLAMEVDELKELEEKSKQVSFGFWENIPKPHFCRQNSSPKLYGAM